MSSSVTAPVMGARDNRLLFGLWGAALLAVGIAVLPFWVPGYSQVRQTVSEIGEMGSPARIPFTLMLCGVAVCLLIFAFPHPLHNVFGQSELIGYQAPLAFALGWRMDPNAQRLVRFSWAMFALIWISIALNLVSLDRHSALWEEMKPIYGLIQRSLFAAWFCWCALLGILLWRGFAARGRGSALPSQRSRLFGGSHRR